MARSPLDVVFVVVAAAQVLSLMLFVVWQEPWSYLGAYFTDDFLVPTLFGELLLRALVILMGVAVLVRREMDLRLLAGAIVSGLFIGLKGIARAANVIESSYYAENRWSLLLSGILSMTALLVAVVGLIRLQQSKAIASDPQHGWRALPILMAFILLVIEWPGRVLPDRFPALSLAVLVISVLLVVGEPSLRLGAVVGFALPVVTSIADYLSTRVLLGEYYYALSWVSIPSLIALAVCSLALIPSTVFGGTTAQSRAA